MSNAVVHFEIAGPDGPALQQYYRDLFGWEIDVQSEEMGNYGIVTANEGGVGGGILGTSENMPARSYVTFYVQVEEIQASLERVVSLGGTTAMPELEIAPGMGSIATFKDPADNTIGLYSPPLDWDGQMTPKGNGLPVVHFEVGGSDASGLAEFYNGMFGWQIDHHEEANYRLIKVESGGIGGGIFEHTEGMPPNHPSIAVMVDDLQAYLDRAVSLGGHALIHPTELPGEFGSIAVFFDAAGNRISLFKSATQNVT